MAVDPREKKQKEKEDKARNEVKKKLLDDGPVYKLFKKGADKLKEKNKKKAGGRIKMNKGGSMPDLSGDGDVTQKDVLIGRGVIKKKAGGKVKQMNVGGCVIVDRNYLKGR